MTNIDQMNPMVSDVAMAARKSADSLMEQAKEGYIRVQELKNSAFPFTEKQAIYEQAFVRLLNSRNFLYLQGCRGEEP